MTLKRSMKEASNLGSHGDKQGRSRNSDFSFRTPSNKRRSARYKSPRVSGVLIGDLRCARWTTQEESVDWAFCDGGTYTVYRVFRTLLHSELMSSDIKMFARPISNGLSD